MAGKNVTLFFEKWQVQDGDPKRNFVLAILLQMSSQMEGLQYPSKFGKM